MDEQAGIDAVGFDLDGTLAVPERDRTAILRDALAAADVAPSAFEAPREAYLSAHGVNLASETRRPVFETLLSSAGVEHADPATAALAYRERIAAALTPVSGAGSLLAALRDRYRVGLLTDGPSVAQRDKLATLEWTDVFDTVLISGELGVGKPDRRAFAALCSALCAPPGRVVYVGDDPKRDVAGASDAGLWTVHVHEQDESPHPRADAAVSRDRLADRLPGLLADFPR